MKMWHIALILILVAGVLAGCGGDTAPSAGDASPKGDAVPVATTASAEEQASSAQAPEDSEGSGGYTSAALDMSYTGALPASSQLALGTLQLEGTEDAVTPEQAKVLLPLWQAIQSGSLQSNAETNAVAKQIEGMMTSEQLASIAAMQLTVEDLGTWMQEQGLSFGPPPGAAGGQNSFGNMSEEERAAVRATAQAGGGMPGGGGIFGNMSEEERAAMRATAEAGGMTFPGGGRAGAGGGQLAMMAEQVVELLNQRVAE